MFDFVSFTFARQPTQLLKNKQVQPNVGYKTSALLVVSPSNTYARM